MQVRNLVTLVFCQLISATGSIVMVTLGAIIGSQLTPSAALSTLPLSMTVIATAATTIPATMLMRRIGRRKGFAMSSGSTVIAMLIAIVALREQSFYMYCAAAMLFGVNMAFTQQYRYAAAESVEPRYVPRAVSLVLVGSIGGAVLGKQITVLGFDWFESVPYAGTMVALAFLYGLQACLFLSMGVLGHDESADGDGGGRPHWEIVRQHVFAVAVLGGVAGYGLMTLVMTATPLSMHVGRGFSLEETASVIQYHVLAMYVPSLFAGFIIERIGVVKLMFAGALALIGTSIIGLQGHSYMHYWWALVLLGVGWNFLYVGGTTMLTYTYTMAERFRAQGVNEFLVFGTSATASLLAGTVLHYFGWTTLMLIPLPVLLAVCLALIIVRNDPLLNREARVNAG